MYKVFYDKSNYYRRPFILLLEDYCGTGVNGHAWFAGFFETSDNKIYFALYLDDEEQASSAKAKEISADILEDIYINK